MRSISALAIAGIFALGMSPTVFAQEQENDDSRLGSRVRVGDQVWVEIDTTDVRTGRVLGVANGMLALAANGAEEHIPISRIWRVQRKQNGIVLGMLIGAGVGFALGLPIAAIGANEGTGVASPLLFMTGIGAAVGTGLDAVLWRKRTVYTSWQPAVTSARHVKGRMTGDVPPDQPKRRRLRLLQASRHQLAVWGWAVGAPAARD